MQKSKIDWCDYSINPIRGLCPVDCRDNQGKSYCYARRLYRRFGWNPEIRFEPIRDSDLPQKPSKIFVGSTMELFGEWVDAFWLDSIFRSVKDNPQHTFIFLTKCPQNLPKEFPDNCWAGVSATNMSMADKGVRCLYKIKAKVKFLSLEPLLSWQHSSFLRFPNFLNWVIIGAQTPYSSKTAPKIEWVREIIEACDKAGIPVFEKNNLVPLFNAQKSIPRWAVSSQGLRQEFP